MQEMRFVVVLQTRATEPRHVYSERFTDYEHKWGANQRYLQSGGCGKAEEDYGNKTYKEYGEVQFCYGINDWWRRGWDRGGENFFEYRFLDLLRTFWWVFVFGVKTAKIKR